MPGRKDFGILRSSFYSDPRAHRAATLYLERGMAVSPHGFATVSGHVVLFGLWAVRETDDGILPGDGIAAAHDALRLSWDDCKAVVGALLDAGLLRTVPEGLYLVGFEDCYAPILGKRRRDRERPRSSDVEATSERRRGDIGATSELRRGDDVVIEPENSGRSDIGATSRDIETPSQNVERKPGTRADRAVPGRAVPAVPNPTVPSDGATTNGHGGGDSASPLNGHGNGSDPPPLSPDDLGVFEMLWRNREKLLNVDAAECDRLAAALRAKSPDPVATRALIDRLTPKFVDEVTKVRRAFRMADNGRKPKR